MEFRFESQEENKRIDKYLAEKSQLSRSLIRSLIDRGEVLVNDKAIKSSYRVGVGDIIVFNYIEDKITLEPKQMDLEIYYEDQDILVIDKKKGLLVHPTSQDQQNTLVNGLIYRYKFLGNMDSIRPGIVHRLDKDTSGLLVVAKTDLAYEGLVEAFTKRRVGRKYLALVHGKIDKTFLINKPIGRNERDRIKFAVNYKNGKEAITEVTPLRIFSDYTLIEAKLFTGRTHQIRVHLASIGRPLVGDLIYGHENKFKIGSQMLHCYYLNFFHPRTGENIEIKTDLPKYFEELIRRIEGESNTK